MEGRSKAVEKKDKFGKREDVKKVAPGYDDEKFGEDATREDKKKGNYTKVVRVFLDENDPGRR